ncbi:MAG TPA: glutathione S-transferase family protein [Aliidongia sp.]|nr:glutathione S-transferase family protein [Aliidongia sp.]
MHTLLARAGWGSAIIEAALELSGQPYRCEIIDGAPGEKEREKLLALNPLGQLPTLLLPDGTVMTESAAMILHLADFTPASELAPPAGAPERAAFLRWLIFLVAAVYPTFTYGDDPSRYHVDEPAQKALRAATDAQREELWRQVEAAAQAPWFLGTRFSAIDLYIWTMTRWRPRRGWFAAECPKLSAIAVEMDRDPRLAGIMARNWPA